MPSLESIARVSPDQRPHILRQKRLAIQGVVSVEEIVQHVQAAALRATLPRGTATGVSLDLAAQFGKQTWVNPKPPPRSLEATIQNIQDQLDQQRMPEAEGKRLTLSEAEALVDPGQLGAVQQALSHAAPKLSGTLADSFLTGGTPVEFVGIEEDLPTYELDVQAVAYARIQDEGGDTGPGHKVHLPPHYYTAKAEEALGNTVRIVWKEGASGAL